MHIAPPSPAPICFVAWKEKVETSPKEPAGFPFIVDFGAWHASSTRKTFFSLQIFPISFKNILEER